MAAVPVELAIGMIRTVHGDRPQRSGQLVADLSDLELSDADWWDWLTALDGDDEVVKASTVKAANGPDKLAAAVARAREETTKPGAKTPAKARNSVGKGELNAPLSHGPKGEIWVSG